MVRPKYILFSAVLAKLVLPGLFFLPLTVFAEQNQIRKPLVIKQIRKEQAGALISRPDPLDERIAYLIKTNNIASVADYAQWLNSHVYYKSDEGRDYWSLPDETLARGRGDCEDLAFLNQAVLGVLGYESRVLCILRPFRSHAICVFEDNGFYQIFDNTSLKHTPCRSFDELARYIFVFYNCGSIAEAALSTKDYRVIFRQTDLASQ